MLLAVTGHKIEQVFIPLFSAKSKIVSPLIYFLYQYQSGLSFLKSKIHNLKNTLDYWKDKFEKLISFLHDKLHSWYDKDDKYIDVVNEMYHDNLLDDDDIKELDLIKEKDDFER